MEDASALMGKRLLIVINDKEGYDISSPQIRAIADSVQKNLEKVGLSSKHASEFSLSLVNAQFAQEGRQCDDPALVEASGIALLEQRMLQEIQRVNGFEIMADLCRYIVQKFTPFAEALTRLGSASVNEAMESYYSMVEDNGKFCVFLEGKIDDKCVTLPASLRRCFGHSTGSVSKEQAEASVKEVYQKYDRDLVEEYKATLRLYLAGLGKRLHKMFELNAIQAPHTDCGMDGDRYEAINERLENASSLGVEKFEAPELSKGSNDIVDDLLKYFPDIMSRVPMPKIPIPMPIPGGPLGVPIIIDILKKIYDLFFGESEEDRKNRQMEARVRAEREAAERQAREKARYEEELKQYCEDMAMEFRREAKRNFRKAVAELMEPLFQQVRDELNKQREIGDKALEDINKLGEIMSSFEILRSDLKTSAI